MFAFGKCVYVLFNIRLCVRFPPPPKRSIAARPTIYELKFRAIWIVFCSQFSKSTFHLFACKQRTVVFRAAKLGFNLYTVANCSTGSSKAFTNAVDCCLLCIACNVQTTRAFSETCKPYIFSRYQNKIYIHIPKCPRNELLNRWKHAENVENWHISVAEMQLFKKIATNKRCDTKIISIQHWAQICSAYCNRSNHLFDYLWSYN